MGLIEDLGGGPVALDTVVFIYYFEEHPRYLPLLAPVFQAIDDGRLPAVTSMLTMLEVLVAPYRAGNQALAERYEEVLLGSEGLTVLPLDASLLRGAASVRAATGIRTPDAIQLSAALAHGCTAFLTNDRRLPELPGLDVVQLDGRL